MSRATPPLRRLATHLVIFDRREKKLLPAQAPASLTSCEKLRSRLAAFTGSGGAHALMARAVALGAEEAAWLQQARVGPDGTIAGLDDLQGQLPAADWFRGEVVLLAQLLGLLTAFIGEDLMLRLVSEVYPQISRAEMKLHQEGKNEKTN